MNDNPTPNEPPLSEEQRQIKELEAEVARLQTELDRALQFKDGYWEMYAEKEDWVRVEREVIEAMQEPHYSLDQFLRELEAKDNIDAA